MAEGETSDGTSLGTGNNLYVFESLGMNVKCNKETEAQENDII